MKKILYSGLVALLAVALAATVAPALAQEANEWSQFQKDKANNGYYDIDVPQSNKVSGQTTDIDARDGSQPVISGNRVYVLTGVDDTSGAIVCYDLTNGKKLWETDIEPPTLGGWGSPAVSGGVVYSGTGSVITAINAETGKKMWEKDLDDIRPDSLIVNSSPTIDEYMLFIGDFSNGCYYCLDTGNRGAVLWEAALDPGCIANSTPAVSGDRVYVGQSAAFGAAVSPNGKVWCLNKADGKPVTGWGTSGYYQTDGKLDVTGSVSVSGDYVYFTDFQFAAMTDPESNLYCLDKQSGALSWTAKTFPSSGTPAVGEGMVVTTGQQLHPDFSSTNWTMAFSSTNGNGGAAQQLWQKKDAGGFNISAAISQGKVVVGNFDANLWQSSGVDVLDAADGSTFWTSDKGGQAVPTDYGLLTVGGGEMVTFDDTTPSTSAYYFAEGCTRQGYREWICLENPGNVVVNSNIRYMLSDGSVTDQPVALPAQSRTTVDVNGFVGEGCDVSAQVTGDGYFVAERSMYVDDGWVSGGEQVMGVTSPRKTHLFAEGCTRDGFKTWLALQNPNDVETNALVIYFYADGTPPKAENVPVGSHTRETLDVNARAGEGKDVSIAVESSESTVAERVMYFQTPDPIEGMSALGVHNSTGTREADTNWYFAEGTTRPNFQEWLCLMNPAGQASNVNIRYMTGTGKVQSANVQLDPNSRQTVDVNREVGPGEDVSALVTSDVPIVAERPMYFQYRPMDTLTGTWGGGHDTAGARYAAYRWEFAEGTTRNGFQTWLCISNPNQLDADVTIEYITADNGTGQKQTETVKVSASSRYTILVNEVVGNGKDVSSVVTCGVPVVVERPMYFDSQGYVGGGDSLGLPGTL